MSTLLNLDFWSYVGIIAGIYTIFALGLQLQFGFAGLLNFGHVGFMALSAYTMAILVTQVGLGLWLAAGAALLVVLPFSLLLGLPTLRLRSDYLAMTTIAFSEIVRYVAINEQWLTGGPQGTTNLLGAGQAASFNREWQTFQGQVQEWLALVIGDAASREVAMLVVVWTVALLLIVVLQYLVRSPWGRVLRAIREDEDAAATLGKDVFWYKQQALAIGAVLAGIAGLFYAFQFSYFSPDDFLPLVTFFAWMILILGGTANNWGVPLGAVVFGFIFASTRFMTVGPFALLDSAERAYVRMIVIGLVLILIVLFRPQGLAGNREEMVLE